VVDSKALSIIVATVLLGPPQAAPMATALLGYGMGKTLVLLSIGHLGSALFLFLFFQALRPGFERLRTLLSRLWVRLLPRKSASDDPRSRKSSSVSLLGMPRPGSRYFFLGAVAFVFAFGSFVGVAATQAVGMKRTRAFAAVMLGCTASVFFWVSSAFYLSKAIDPLVVTGVFIVIGAVLVMRGRIVENRLIDEIKDLGVNGLRVLTLLMEEVGPRRIADETQLRLDEIGSIMEDLSEKGYITSAGQGIYRITSQGLQRVANVPGWVKRSLGLGEEEEEEEK